MSPGQESPVPETQELHRPSRGKGARGELEQDQEGEEALGLPGTLTDTCAPGECAELPKGCSAHGGTGAARRGSGRGRDSMQSGLRGSGSRLDGLQRQLCTEGAAWLGA